MGIRTKRLKDAGDIPPPVLARLRGEAFPADTSPMDAWNAEAPNPRFRYLADASVHEYWLRARDSLLAEWIRDRPGSRPAAWWEFSGPRWQYPDIPETFRDIFVAPRMIMIDGALIEPEYPGGWATMHCGLFALPPWRKVYEGEEMTPHPVETETAYLRRLNLLVPGEAARCRKSPDVVEVPVSLAAYGLERDGDDSEPWKGE